MRRWSYACPDTCACFWTAGAAFPPDLTPGKALVAPALTTNDAPRLAAVCNSHPDLDHMGGLIHVLQALDVPLLLDNGQDNKGARGALWRAARLAHQARALADGDVLLLGDPALDLRLEILHPPRPAAGTAGTTKKAALADESDTAFQSGNNASVVARLTCRGQGLALFTGDAEKPVLRRLLRAGPGPAGSGARGPAPRIRQQLSGCVLSGGAAPAGAGRLRL